MDRRKAKTVKAIKGAFEDLIKEKKYSDISVQDIIDTADVGRATFYDHFKSKEEVLDSISNGIFAHITDEDLHAERHHDFSKMQDFTHRIVHMLYHLSEDKEVIFGILSSESHDIFLEDLRNHLDNLFKANIKEEDINTSIPKEIYLNHLVTSLMELVQWWIKENKCVETPENIATYYFKLVNLN